MWSMAASRPSTTFTAMIASRYSVDQSASVAGVDAGDEGAGRLVAADGAAGLLQRLDERLADSVPATARSTSSVSAAPQTLVRRILALTTIFFAMARSARS